MGDNNTKEKIIKNATNLFIRQGYSGTSVKQIANATGVSPPALYYFFEGGKLEILREVIKTFEIHPETKLDSIKDSSSFEDLLARIHSCLPDAMHLIFTNLNWIRNEMHFLTEEDRDFVMSYPLAYTRVIQQEIENESYELDSLAKHIYEGLGKKGDPQPTR